MNRPYGIKAAALSSRRSLPSNALVGGGNDAYLINHSLPNLFSNITKDKTASAIDLCMA